MKRTIFLSLLLLIVTQFSFAQSQKRIKAFAHAIARTEGAYIPGTIPNRYSNPGDLKALPNGKRYPGQIGIGKAGHVIFRNKAAGYAALYHQIEKMLNGTSKVYTQDMTLQQVAKKYAGNYQVWAKNLTAILGVPPSTTLEEYFELAPRVKFELQEFPLDDNIYMLMAHSVAAMSPNHGRKTSAVFVRDGEVITADYNTFPEGVQQFPERLERPTCYIYVEHAERNAIAKAAKKGIRLEGCTVYMAWFPCVECARTLVNAGIVRVVCIEPDWVDAQYHFQDSRTVLLEGGIEIHYYITERS
jgi:dCMP deaminase